MPGSTCHVQPKPGPAASAAGPSRSCSTAAGHTSPYLFCGAVLGPPSSPGLSTAARPVRRSCSSPRAYCSTCMRDRGRSRGDRARSGQIKSSGEIAGDRGRPGWIMHPGRGWPSSDGSWEIAARLWGIAPAPRRWECAAWPQRGCIAWRWEIAGRLGEIEIARRLRRDRDCAEIAPGDGRHLGQRLERLPRGREGGTGGGKAAQGAGGEDGAGGASRAPQGRASSFSGARPHVVETERIG